MAATQDWLPQNHEALYNQGTQTTAYVGVEANQTRMGIVGASLTWLNGTYKPAWSAFGAAFEAWRDPATRTEILTAAMRDARKTFEAAYRQLYTGLLKGNPNVTDSDLVAMGLPERKSGGRAPVPVPTTVPEVDGIDRNTPRRLVVKFHDTGSDRRGKPAGVLGAVHKWAVLDAPPADHNALGN
jgi:hypothetical protein